MGKVMQLLFAVISPPAASSVHLSLEHNLMAAATGATRRLRAPTFTDLKSGYLLGANRAGSSSPSSLAFSSGPSPLSRWYLMVPTKENSRPSIRRRPTCGGGRGAPRRRGLDQLPPSAKMAIVIGALVGVILPLLGKLLPKAGPYLPSAMAWSVVGDGFQQLPGFRHRCDYRLLWTKLHARSAEGYSVALASGFIAGESLIKAVIAMTATAIGLLASKL